MVTQNPNIYGLDAAYDVKDIQKTAKEKLADISNYQDVLKNLEVHVALNESEIKKNRLRIVSYATDPHRGGIVDTGEKKGSVWMGSKKIYESLVAKLKDAPGYFPPSDKEAKVFYDIGFRLGQLGFNKSSKGEQLHFASDYTNDLAIAIMAFQKMSGASKIESIVGPETLWKLLQDTIRVSSDASAKKISDTMVVDGVSSQPSSPSSELSDSKPLMSSSDQTPSSALETIPSSSSTAPFISQIYPEMVEDKMPFAVSVDKNTISHEVKQFSQAYALSNTLDNITKDELKLFDKLDRKLNKNDKLYDQFESTIVGKIENTYKGGKIKTFEGNILQNVHELIRNYAEGYLNENTAQQKEIEVDPKFFFAIKDTILEWLSSDRSQDEKQRLILFVKGFTSNFNDILDAYQK